MIPTSCVIFLRENAFWENVTFTHHRCHLRGVLSTCNSLWIYAVPRIHCNPRTILVISIIIIIFILFRRSTIKLIMDHIMSMCMSIMGQHGPCNRQAWEQQWHCEHSFRKPTVLYFHGKLTWQWKSVSKIPNLSTNEPFSIATLV